MKSKQLFFVLIACVVLLGAGFIAVAYYSNSLLSKQAVALSKYKADSNVNDQLQATLTKNKADIAKYSQLNQIAETIVPQDKDQAEAVREIVNLAAESGIGKLSSITFPASSLGSTVPGAKTNSSLTQLTPVSGIAGVYNLQITVTQSSADEVPYSAFTTFLAKLEQNRRTAQVSSITIQPDSKAPGQVSFTLVINEFVKP